LVTKVALPPREQSLENTFFKLSASFEARNSGPLPGEDSIRHQFLEDHGRKFGHEGESGFSAACSDSES